MKIYKFMRCDDRVFSALKNKEIFSSSPLKFNDPYDSRLRITSNLNDKFFDVTNEYFKLNNLDPHDSVLIVACAKLGYPIHDLEYIGQEVPLPPFTDLFYEVLSHIKDGSGFCNFVMSKFESTESVHLFFKHISEIGVISFVKEKNLPHMWAYYADLHKGFCLEFDTSKPLNSSGKLVDVVYSSEPLLLVNGQELTEDHFHQALFTKASHWKEEREVRYINKNSNSLISFPFELTGICTGYGMSKENFSKLEQIWVEDDMTYYYILPDHEEHILRWTKQYTCFL